MVNISAKSKSNPNPKSNNQICIIQIQNSKLSKIPNRNCKSKTESQIQFQISNPKFVSWTTAKFCKETASLDPKKIQKTSNKFSYSFRQTGDVISHKKYSTIKQIPKRKSFLVWTNVKSIGQIQNPKFQNSNLVAMAKNYLQHAWIRKITSSSCCAKTSITSHCHIPKLCPSNFFTCGIPNFPINTKSPNICQGQNQWLLYQFVVRKRHKSHTNIQVEQTQFSA